MSRNFTDSECRAFNRKIGLFLKKCRYERSLSGAEVAGQIMVSQQQLSRYERGESAVGLFQLDKILRAYGVSWDRFVSETIVDIPYSSYESLFSQGANFMSPDFNVKF
ncbi:helix-turn-helix domain-containing protein [Morganella sp. EGD-HP17]|uniref:helix-turn-helix domain-containing protein n=1 Tax=Morganella sp. EGD-HP17 TaxID=1435146 RepID=UPI0003FBE3BC|nr:helix-turn-helix transcriptional regulator [Morganella sp. EGD-HP17]ETO41185.1 hypothetical protein X965_12975 [Morganella sp. EGD-HP17]